MNISKIALALGLTLGLGACGGVSKEDATIGYSLASALAMSSAQQARSLAGQSLRTTESLPGVCPGGGSVDYSGSGTATALNFTFSFNSCSLSGGYVFDGSWTIAGSVEATTVVGSLSLSGPNLDFSCDFDMTVNASGTVSGTACGYDVSELNATGG